MTKDIIRVLVIDDSAYNRRAITKMLESSEMIKVIDTARDGEEGIKKAIELNPDLITLDLHMPLMDGFTFLRIILNKKPIPVLVVSAKSDDQNVFRAMELGAVDFLAKPGFNISPDLYNIQDDLVNKVLDIKEIKMRNVQKRAKSFREEGIKPGEFEFEPKVVKKEGKGRKASKANVVAIGSSTGGPTALQKLLSGFPSSLPASVVISQHMPPGFTSAFAERLNSHSAMEVREAKPAEELKEGIALISPGGYHMEFDKVRDKVIVNLVKKSPEEKYVPSIDRMFKSLANIYRSRILGVILTGMGDDGRDGVKYVQDKGGTILVESKESAIIYGMPREAVKTGAVERELPLDKLIEEIVTRC